MTASRIGVWLLLAGLVVAPLAMVVSLALGGNQVRVLLADGLIVNAWHSLWTSVVSAALSVAMGVGLALLVDRTDLPGRRWLRLLALTPMLVPPFVGAIAWAGLLGPGGLLNRGHEVWNIYGGDGVVILLTLHAYPMAYLIVAAALNRLPATGEEAARISGASPWRAFAEVTLPLLRPAALAAFTLNAVAALGDFGIPALIGVPERFHTLATMVYRYIQSGTVTSPLQITAQIGLVLLVLGTAGVVGDYLLSRRATAHAQADADAPAPLRLGRFRAPVAALAWLGVAVVTVLPLVALGLRAVIPAPGVPLTPQTVSLANFATALASRNTQIGIENSLLLAAGAAVLCTVLGLVVGVLTTRVPSRDNPAMTLLTMLPQAIPGMIIAVGWLILGRYTGLYNTRWLILLAYVTSFTAIVMQAVRAPLLGVPDALPEAARVAGASPFRALLDVAVPLARPAAVAGGLLVGLTALRELTLSVLLLAPGKQTLGVVIFNFQQAGDYNSASALSLLVALLGVAGLGLLGYRAPTAVAGRTSGGAR